MGIKVDSWSTRIPSGGYGLGRGPLITLVLSFRIGSRSSGIADTGKANQAIRARGREAHSTTNAVHAWHICNSFSQTPFFTTSLGMKRRIKPVRVRVWRKYAVIQTSFRRAQNCSPNVFGSSLNTFSRRMSQHSWVFAVHFLQHLEHALSSAGRRSEPWTSPSRRLSPRLRSTVGRSVGRVSALS